MKIEVESYLKAKERLPDHGQYIIGHQTAKEIVLYQAFKSSIAQFAVAHQFFGGSEYGYGRMSWIKPNFLWMMYRCGWAEKENQEHVLAIWVDKMVLEGILAEAVLSSFNPVYHDDQAGWKRELEAREVRLQWDPDHDPYGNKLNRRAIQLGLKGRVLERFGKEQVRRIEDITEFVKEQKNFVYQRRLDLLQVPVERVWEIGNFEIKKRVGMTE
jgi:hypothetical protein